MGILDAIGRKYDGGKKQQQPSSAQEKPLSKPVAVDGWQPYRMASGVMEAAASPASTGNLQIDPETKKLRVGNANMSAAADYARRQVQTPLQTRLPARQTAAASQDDSNADVLRTKGLTGWLAQNYPKNDYGKRIQEMKRKKAAAAFGNMATVLGQVAALGIGARRFDKVQDTSGQYEDYIQKLKDAQMNYNLNKFSVAYNAANADAQRAAAAQEAENTRRYNLEAKKAEYAYEAAKQQQEHADNMELEAVKAAVQSDRLMRQQAFTAQENEKDRRNAVHTANIRSGSKGSGKYYGTLTIEGKDYAFPTQADYKKAVQALADKYGIPTEEIYGGINSDGSGYGAKKDKRLVERMAADVEKASREAMEKAKAADDDDEGTAQTSKSSLNITDLYD